MWYRRCSIRHNRQILNLIRVCRIPARCRRHRLERDEVGAVFRRADSRRRRPRRSVDDGRRRARLAWRRRSAASERGRRATSKDGCRAGRRRSRSRGRTRWYAVDHPATRMTTRWSKSRSATGRGWTYATATPRKIAWRCIHVINPLTPTVAMGTAIKHPGLPDGVTPSFVIFDIRTLWRFVCVLQTLASSLYLAVVMAVGRLRSPVRRSGTRCLTSSEIRRYWFWQF